MLVIVVDPPLENTGEGERIGPLLPLQTRFFQGAHDPLGVRLPFEVIIAHDIHLPLASHRQQGSVPGTILPPPTRLLDVLAYAQEPSTCGIFPEGEELCLRGLALVHRRHPSIDCDPLVRYHSSPIT
jgi:hypothetical protein